ncbi:hypothetical protein L249_2725 [Ophiocordyceps polyrhachis-furcata BCC 54312]|uniref:Transcriptional regulatory protein RXT2 N-terminal domain-containing protein n=1 Tax=Ophiocordyceps polyrhachis-furcata BCC 54312 TaxID=1330021 RepID=A0A367LRC4_9HYPO|nr:hypothetical protein L249_2725 [Ophiocordyceps polyrhachis-furcata BCC 54312]
MASQQILFAETIAGIKKALKRKAYESDSDTEMEGRGNRGHKLKKRARFAHEGQLAPTEGPSAYKETVEFAGTLRSIIHRNPPMLDENGYEIDSDDDDERVEEAALASAQVNPYANVRLEQILAPLTSSTDLPTHPTLSKPFLSKTLTNLVSQSSELMRRENQSLWRTRHLWTALCGDGIWMPCGFMVEEDDVALYTEDHVARHLESLARASHADGVDERNGQQSKRRAGGVIDTLCRDDGSAERLEEVRRSAEVLMKHAGTTVDSSKQGAMAFLKVANEQQKSPAAGIKSNNGDDDNGDVEHKTVKKPRREDHGTDEAAGSRHEQEDTRMKDVDPAADTTAPPRTGGGRAPSMVSEGSLEQQAFIHPIFSMPAGARPDRNLGLPEHEAADIRRLLALFVQKQEEICRGATRLHHGLLRAERLRQDVLHWAKAEAHCGPNRDLSDGEDWYDREEWGLTEDLKKGQDEEEEDTATAGKKTRNRR